MFFCLFVLNRSSLCSPRLASNLQSFCLRPRRHLRRGSRTRLKTPCSLELSGNQQMGQMAAESVRRGQVGLV